MKSNFNKCFVLLCFVNFQLLTKAQNFYDLNTLQKIEINFSQSNWDYILDTSKAGADNYIIAQWVKVNGIQFDSAGVKYKGNSSYNASNTKNPFHIELDFVKNQDYQGYKDIKLSNAFKDPSQIREALAYSIMNKYSPSPLANFCQVYVNGAYIGLYTNTEAVSKTFVNSRFGSKTNSFFFMDNFGCNLNYLGADSSFYSAYTIKSDYGWLDFIRLCDTLKNKPSSIETILDVDRTLWMFAFDNLLVNLDSYIGAPMHNYYLYEDDNGRFNPIIWDVNEAFGNFTNAGGAPPLTIAQEQTMSAWLHSTDPNWPLISKLFPVPMYKKMYIAHMRTIMTENFTNNLYTAAASSMQAIIDTAVQSDINKFYTYSQFQTNISANVVQGTQTITGISSLMNPRISYLQSTSDFTATPPTISSPYATGTPSLNTAITITASITNANNTGVFLGYRFASKDKFIRAKMFDDGLHNDGSAGDNKFGATFTMTSSQAQYYIYAENNNAGIFSPERAEYEYHTLIAVQTATTGQVFINEFLADNTSDVKNEFNQYEDWLELYNATSGPLELSGLYLTDDFAVPNKFTFPQNTIIPANGYLIVWADNNPSTASYVHCNFKLAAGGEQIMLSNSNGVVLDSITYSTQNPDQSFARCPDGSGPFTTTSFATFNLSNCAIGVNELNDDDEIIKIFPNPAKSFFIVKGGDIKHHKLEVYNALGTLVHESEFIKETTVDASMWAEGVYFVKTGHFAQKVIIGR